MYDFDFEDVSLLKREHGEFYGVLILFNQRIYNVGTSLFWVMIPLAIVFCVAVHMRWFEAIFGVSTDFLRGWGVYLVIVLGVLIAFGVITSLREKRVYGAIKPEILNYLKMHGISMSTFLVEIADDPNLGDLRARLLDDKALQLGEQLRLP